MIQKLEEIGNRALQDVEAARELNELEAVRIAVLGKKGALSEVLKGLGTTSAEERPKIGAVANEWKRKLEDALSLRKSALEAAVLSIKLSSEKIDTSLPARAPHRGVLHPITQTIRRVNQVFMRLGFDVMTGPEVETDFLNFEAVNIPKDHPARDMQDTFFINSRVVLRTHTSAVQMRALQSKDWPVRIICPGAVYRSDHDATHSPMFHQIEGLWVDQGIKMSDLKGVLEFFARELFGTGAKIRLRPSYFPFVEPGAEVDVNCFECKGNPVSTCRVCKGTGWLEILGAGMVHPKLFELAGKKPDGAFRYDPQTVTGFAFGMGVERIAMLLHQISDLRLMFEGDARFLQQF